MPEHQENKECIIKFTELKSRVDAQDEKIDDLKEMIGVIHEMNQNIAVIANETKNQGKQLDQLFGVIEIQGNEIQQIKDNTETKETVAKLADKVDILEKKDGHEAEKQLKQLKWLVVSTMVLGTMGIVWSAVAN